MVVLEKHICFCLQTITKTKVTRCGTPLRPECIVQQLEAENNHIESTLAYSLINGI